MFRFARYRTCSLRMRTHRAERGARESVLVQGRRRGGFLQRRVGGVLHVLKGVYGLGAS